MSKAPTQAELEEIRKMFDDNYQPKFKAGDAIIDEKTGRHGVIQELTVYEGVWYSIHWTGSTLPDKIWNAYEIDQECRLV